MVNKKTHKKSSQKVTDYQNFVYQQVQNKFIYFVLGLSIIIIGYFSFSLIFNLNRQSGSYKKPTFIKRVVTNPTITPSPKVNKYQVKPGDHLWSIAERFYNSGYNAYDIASANNITNPNIIHPGRWLVIPSVAPKMIIRQQDISATRTTVVTITNQSYTVKSGDNLWQIALQAYGDGYAWVKIARFNNLNNPDFIYPGQTLIIPR